MKAEEPASMEEDRSPAQHHADGPHDTGGVRLSAARAQDGCADGRLTLAEVLDILGSADGEFTAVCHRPVEGVYSSEVRLSHRASRVVAGLSEKACVWFGINPIAGPERQRDGRGNEREVTRWATLHLNLAIKSGSFETLEQIGDYIGVVSQRVGTRPSVLIYSAHGVQPLWAIEDGQLDSPEKWERANTLARRFGRLAYTVCVLHFGYGMDSVPDMSTVLRTPNTTNWKFPERPVGVYAERDIGGPLTVDAIEEFLDEWAPEIGSDRLVGGDVLSPPELAVRHRRLQYADAMIAGWAGDTPTARKAHLARISLRSANVHKIRAEIAPMESEIVAESAAEDA